MTMGPACKIIINMLMAALMKGIEQSMLSSAVRGVLIKEAEADDILARLREVDYASYNGGPVPEGLARILLRLTDLRIVERRVWTILVHPDLEVPEHLTKEG
jgi:hypothetical protein